MQSSSGFKDPNKTPFGSLCRFLEKVCLHDNMILGVYR